MSKQTEFISKIAPIIKRYVKQYGFTCCSGIIAQACLESAWGTSDKAAHHNYFGLKYRNGRVSCHSGYFKAGSMLPKVEAAAAFAKKGGVGIITDIENLKEALKERAGTIIRR